MRHPSVAHVGDVQLADLELLHQDLALGLALGLEQHAPAHHDVAAPLVQLDDLNSNVCPRSSSMLGTRRNAIWLPGRNASTPIRSTTTPPLIFFTSVPCTASSFS